MNEMYVFWMIFVASIMMKQAHFESHMKCLFVWVSFGGEINCLVKIRVGNADWMNGFENVASVLNKAC